MDPEVRQLRAFTAVVDAGTFTDAAATLGMSQTAVSRSVQSLEATLGARLFRRTTRQVALTGTGARLLPHARRVLAEITLLRRAAAEQAGELRLGYAWSALGRHTRRVQKAWSRHHPGVPLILVHANTLTAGLADGTADVAVVRRTVDDHRFDAVPVGSEARVAAVATESSLARRRSVRLSDLTRQVLAVDHRTGTTDLSLWAPGEEPTITRDTHSVDEWLTLIAAGQAAGVTSEATAHQNPRPGVAYRRLRDAPPIEVRLAWWRDDPPPLLGDLIAVVRSAYAGPGQVTGRS